MFATITQAARAGAISAVERPNLLTWRTLGAAWTVWLCGFVLGTTDWYWGGLLALSGLWMTSAATDRLVRFDAVSMRSAALVRTVLLGATILWIPRAIAQPGADLAIWTAIVVTAAAAHLLAPWVTHNRGWKELARWWNDVKAASAAGGGLIVAAVFLGLVATSVGLPFGEDTFVAFLAGAVFCAIPTTLSLRCE